MHYNWHRSYDPTLGRYTQPDPLGFVDGPSVYGYAGGSPHMLVDKDGRFLPFIIPFIPTIIGGVTGYIIDYELKKYLEQKGCKCSTASTALNVAAGAILGDYSSPSFSKQFSREKTTLLSRVLFGPRGYLRQVIGSFIPRSGPPILTFITVVVDIGLIIECESE